MIFSLLVGMACLVVAALLKSRAAFAVAAICWVQNLLVPWWYTEEWIGETTAQALLLTKELLLLLLLAYAGWRTRHVWRERPPAPVYWILGYGVWAALRVGAGVALGGGPLLEELRLMRSMLFPAEAVLAGFLVALLAPRVAPTYERFTVVGLAVCAIVSLALYVLPSDTFWADHVNIAAYNVNVKGDPEWTVQANLGVSGTGVGRAQFRELSPFRLIGTFGDPLTAGMLLGLGVLALAARPRLEGHAVLAGIPIVAALFLTFSRSAWILAAVGFVYLAVRQRRPGRLALLAGAVVVLWVAVAPLRLFVIRSVAALALESGDIYHAQGILTFYSAEMLKPVYLVGGGPLDTSTQTWVLENGLAYLTVQFGLPLLVTFLGFCVSAERYLRRHARPEDLLARLGAACALASLVVANFSFYALSFTAYFGIWSFIGLGIGLVHRRRLEEAG